MDGLTISNAQRMLKSGDTLSEIQESQLKSQVSGKAQGPEKSFSETLTEAIDHVNDLQVQSNQKIQELATGKTKNIPEVMIQAEKAGTAMKLAVQVRNKAIDAYKQVMKMQV